jgi:pimeloyl-ACP methyl ester carboxylesterase
MWRDFPERLAEETGRSVFLYSRQGHGLSDPGPARHEPDYMEREAERVLPGLLGQAGIERPVLFGHSDGGSIALIYAAAYPHGVAGLILEAPHVFVEPLTVAGIAEATAAYEVTDLRPKLARHHRDADHVFGRWSDIWLDPRFRAWNIEARLPQIRCPILMIQGQDDEYGTQAQLEAIASSAGGEILMLAQCRHAPHRDQPDAVLQASCRFLAALPSGPVRP